MSYEVTTQKTVIEYPVTVEECKEQLQMTQSEFGDQRNYIEGLIKTATIEAEAVFEADIAYTYNTVNLYDFSGSSIRIDEGNFNNLVSIITDASISLDASNTFPYYTYFVLDLSSSVFSDPLEVKFYTGFKRTECPENIKTAIKMRVRDYFDVQRTSMSTLNIYDTKAFERLILSTR